MVKGPPQSVETSFCKSDGWRNETTSPRFKVVISIVPSMLQMSRIMVPNAPTWRKHSRSNNKTFTSLRHWIVIKEYQCLQSTCRSCSTTFKLLFFLESRQLLLSWENCEPILVTSHKRENGNGANTYCMQLYISTWNRSVCAAIFL